MSLVVLRSWSDGQPPKIKGIAPPDSDDKNEVVVPDHHGRFVTEEAPKFNPKVTSGVGAIRERFIKLNSGSEYQNPRVAKFWNRKSLPIPNSVSVSPNSLSPSPTNNHQDDRPDKIDLSRESSIQSLQSTDPDSSPSSPVGGVSRYKSLGAELAATIPKRQIIRDTWVKDSYSIFRKKELSKSTPSLNLSLAEDHLETVSPESNLLQSERGRSSTLGGFGRTSGKHLSPRPISFIDSDKSWKDSVYGAEFEPKFGDKPASVVGVIKKDKEIRVSGDHSGRLSEFGKLTSPVPFVSKNSTETLVEISKPPGRANNYFSTSASSFDNQKPGSGSDSGSDSLGHKETDFPDQSHAHLQRVKRIAKKAIRSVSFELDAHLRSKEASKPRFDSEFPVHRAIHPSLELPEGTGLEDSDSGENVIIRAETKDKNAERAPKEQLVVNVQVEPEVEEDEDVENEGIDLELDALRVESSSGGESERESIILEQAEKQNFCDQDRVQVHVLNPEEREDMYLNNLRKNSLESSTERRDSNRNSHGHGNKNGSAYAQVPVQCVNRHVIIPAKAPVIQNQHDDHSTMNGDSLDYGNGNNGKTNLRRKNFCDELLSNVILQVPPMPPTPPAPIIIMQRPLSPQNLQENHDGIIIFDEEDEFEESETDSIALSERENSFEYLSVFHNVKVGSPTDNKSRPVEPAHIIGLDFGSTYSRYCSLDKSTGAVQIGEAFRTLVTSDGLTQGMKAIYHSMATKSKLIYKWRTRQTFPYDPYDDEDNSGILEVLFRHYGHLLKERLQLRVLPDQRSDSALDADDDSSPSVQWNVSVHSAMEKKLVREAAFSSGLVKPTDELRLVNESTAAAVTAYQFLKANSTHKKGVEKTFLSVNIGSTYIHTSGYQYSSDGKLQMVENGDSQTFQSPETMFVELLARVFSREFLLKFESRFTPSWVEILIRFEEMKDNYLKLDSECYLFLPVSFFLEFFKCTGIQVPECIEDNSEEGIVWDNNGAIRFRKDLMDEWFQPTLDFIKARIKIKSYDAIVLSGGGSNEILRKELEQLVPSTVQVHLLDNPDKAVVQGLVNLDKVKLSLKSPFSIGVGVMTPFDELIHPQEKCVTRSGKKWCSDVWDNLIRKGHPMVMGEIILKRTYVGAQPGQNVLVLPIFKSDLEEPKLVTSPSVEKCCELRFEINKEKSWREVQLVIKCSDRELCITATGNDGDISQVVIDY